MWLREYTALYLVRLYLYSKSAISINVNDLMVRFQIACQRGISAPEQCAITHGSGKMLFINCL